jgi:hypothetical protein
MKIIQLGFMRKGETAREPQKATSACPEKHPEACPSNCLMPVYGRDGHWTVVIRPVPSVFFLDVLDSWRIVTRVSNISI